MGYSRCVHLAGALAAIVLLIPAAHAAPGHPLTARNKADIVRQVKDRLIDGESARWRWPLNQGFGLYCAWVNSKNRMGAYTGWTPFMVIGGVGTGPKSTGQFAVFNTEIANADLSSDGSSIVLKMCTEKGYDLTNGPPPE